ncbi:MAG: DUF488 family protein [Acidimicrobiia bacterium]|nr:DUF488 family protein [Acidimicrobiia bacterium]NNF10390.1 DUF488 family protein [Acidimicrobiia bacterium]NNL71595.1 DUF488 family protein [Acidimicrobiia bacterium]
MIRTKRVWDPHESSDGARFLVDGRWPPGVRPDSLRIVLWVRDAAPSTKLMRSLRKRPDEWESFRRSYIAELDADPAGWEPILRQARLGPVTLLYALRDRRHNNAVVLADYLTAKLDSGNPESRR